jgi:hypothetical protein
MKCWRHGCDGRQIFEGTVTTPTGRTRLVFRCVCGHACELLPEHIEDYKRDTAQPEITLHLANALEWYRSLGTSQDLYLRRP